MVGVAGSIPVASTTLKTPKITEIFGVFSFGPLRHFFLPEPVLTKSRLRADQIF
jgi:hypothetical protein